MEEWIEKIEFLLPHVQEYILSLEQENKALNEQVNLLAQRLKEMQKEKERYEQKYDALKVTQALLGSDEKRTEAKLKINGLIREIEQCIRQLSQEHQ